MSFVQFKEGLFAEWLGSQVIIHIFKPEFLEVWNENNNEPLSDFCKYLSDSTQRFEHAETERAEYSSILARALSIIV